MDALDETRDLILLQRSSMSTRYGLSRESHYRHVEAALFKETRADFKGMIPFLPDDLSSTLDIGCGVGSIDVLLALRYPSATIYVLDGVEPSGRRRKHSYGPAEGYSVFSRSSLTMGFLRGHGVEATWLSIGDPLPKADLVISLSSWGWHYPVSEYAAHVTGRVIMDIRENTEGIEAMEAAGFVHVGTIPKDSKGAREVFDGVR